MTTLPRCLRRLAATTALLLSLALSACGGDNSSDATATPEDPTSSMRCAPEPGSSATVATQSCTLPAEAAS